MAAKRNLKNLREATKMKIVVITGSAHKHGTTAALADQFQQGARRRQGMRFSVSTRHFRRYIRALAAINAAAPDAAYSMKTI